MPQDSLRSFMYRPFITCDDPKGVVECKTIRKSKSKLQRKEREAETRVTQKSVNMPSPCKKERKDKLSKGFSDELRNSSAIQPMEVSKGAQKLNEVVDSWSRGSRFDNPSKDIAEDLLRGALGLQESLIMLGKLQEASQYIAKLKKKQKAKAREGKVDEKHFERTNSERFDERGDKIEFQRPRLSADASSGDCYEELRQVIRDGLARQNFLRKVYAEERAYFDGRKVELSPDFPSTSSSRSSVIHSHDFTSSEYSASEAQQEKPKVPNLIARLMGLEEIPSRPVCCAPQKQLDKDKILNQRRPIFEIDLPKARKPPVNVQKVNRERRTLEEIIESMHFKGLLKGKAVEKSKHETHSIASDPEKRIAADAPPIVLIKPLHIPDGEGEELHSCKSRCEERDSDTQSMLQMWKIEKEFASEMIDRQEGAVNFTIYRRLEADKTPKRFYQEKGAKASGGALTQSDDIETSMQEKLSSSKVKAPVPADTKQQKKEEIEKKVHKIQRAVLKVKKPVENSTVRDVLKSCEQGKKSPEKLRKPARGPNESKNQVVQQRDNTANTTSKRTTTTPAQNFGKRKTNVKADNSSSKPPIPPVKNKEYKNDGKQNDTICENDTDSGVNEFTASGQLQCEEVTDASQNLVIDECNTNKCFPCDFPMTSFQNRNDINSKDDINGCISDNLTDREFYETGATARNLLLYSASFLTRAQELFDTDVQLPMASEAGSNEFGAADLNLLLDCANELLEQKKQRALAISQYPKMKTRIRVCINQLVHEISEGIESLRHYHKHEGQLLLADTVSAVLERDLWSKGVVTGAWDLGWGSGFTLEEVEQVVFDIEEVVLSGVIEDVLTDFGI